jgi:hypothetical protein
VITVTSRRLDGRVLGFDGCQEKRFFALYRMLTVLVAFSLRLAGDRIYMKLTTLIAVHLHGVELS